VRQTEGQWRRPWISCKYGSPSWDARSLHALVSALVGIADGSRTQVLVNDRVDVARAAAAGAHLRHDSIPPALARKVLRSTRS
jgi:thiamine monophosphate synthase